MSEEPTKERKKMKIKTILAVAVLASGSTLLLPSEAAGQGAKPASVVTLKDLRAQLHQLQTDISSTVNTLNVVKQSAKKDADLAKAVAELGARFKALEARVETLRSNAITVKARVKEHYEAWSKELTAMQNPSLRERAQDRLTRSQKEFDKIVAEAGETKAEVLPFISELKDIVIYLDADTSEAAVDSLSSTIWKLGNRTKSVNGSIENLIEQIDDTIKSLPQR